MKRTWLRVQFQPTTPSESATPDNNGDAVDAQYLSADESSSVRSVTLTEHDGALKVSEPEAKV